jgi:hypothetical protein
MKWKTRPLPLPKDGDVRNRLRFAWVPTDIKGTTVWLERFEVREIYRVFSSPEYRAWIEADRSIPVWY